MAGIIDYINQARNKFSFLKWVQIIPQESLATKKSALYFVEKSPTTAEAIIVDDLGQKRKIVGGSGGSSFSGIETQDSTTVSFTGDGTISNPLSADSNSISVTKTSELTNDGADGVNAFITAKDIPAPIDISNKADRDGSNITAIISWRQALDIYNKLEVNNKFIKGGQETLTAIQQPVLVGNILTVSYIGENGVLQQQTVDLSSLATIDIHIEDATYDTSTNVITITDTEGAEYKIDLSEFSIITNTNVNGVTTLTQEAVTKLIISKVGQTGSYNDLLDKPNFTNPDFTLRIVGNEIISNISTFEQNFFNTSEIILAFEPVQILGVFVDGYKIKDSEYNITLPSKIKILIDITNKNINCQYRHLIIFNQQ